MADSVLITNTQAVSSAGAANVSLIKIGTLAQTIIGLFITGAVVIATAATITLISVGAGVKSPIAKSDIATTMKKAPVNIFVLLNDEDPKGGNLTVIGIVQPKNGFAEIVSGRYVKYTPNADFAGVDYMNYTVTNDRATASAGITVTVVNTPPVAVDFFFEISKNSQDNKFDLFSTVQGGSRIEDFDNDDLFLIDLSGFEHGSARIENNTILYTPNAGFRYTDTFNYTISDNYDTDTAVVTIQVRNDPPRPQPDHIVSPKNVVLNFRLIDNDVDPNDDNITITSIGPSKALQRINDDKESVTYLPNPTTDPYADSFEYTVSDGDLSATSYVTISMVNTPPVAFNNTLTCFKNSEGNRVPLGALDSDILDSLTFTLNDAETQGGVSLEQSTISQNVFFADNWYNVPVNSFTAIYTPRHGLVGSDQIEFVVTDGYDKVSGFVQVTVLNQAPIAIEDIANCSKHLSIVLNVTANDEDPNGDDVKLVDFTEITTALGGRVERVNDNEVKYFAPQNTDSTPVEDSFEYEIVDIQEKESDAMSAKATVRITLLNDPPVAVDDQVSVPRNVITKVHPLENDYDPNNDQITIVSIDDSDVGVATVTLKTENGEQFVEVNGGNNVAQYTIPYVIEDVESEQASANIIINVVNTKPVAVDDQVTVTWNQLVTFNVIDNDTDENGDDLVIIDFTNPQNGRVTLDADRKSFIYVPNNGFVGDDSFTYKNYDGIDNSENSATVSISVLNQAPVAAQDTATTHWTRAVSVNVLNNDSDPDGDDLTISDVETPAHGTASISVNSGANAAIVYTPTNYIGSVTFPYTITDGNLEDSANIVVQVTNTVPVAEDDAISVHWADESVSIDSLSNDNDADGDSISLNSVTQPTKGSAEITGSRITYTVGAVEPASLGTFEFNYDITDGAQTSDAAKVTVTVTNNDKPTAASHNDRIHWREFLDGKEYLINGRSSGTDGDTYTITPSSDDFTVTEQGPGLTLKLEAVDENWKTGSGSVQYTVSDGIESASGQINLEVYNNAPTTEDYKLERHWTLLQSGVYFNVLSTSNDVDALDANILTISGLDLSGMDPQSTASVQQRQSVDQIFYKPSVDKVGSDIIVFQISDGLATVEGTINVTVSTLQLTSQEQFYTIHWRDSLNTPVTFPLIDNLEIADDSSLELVPSSLVEGDEGGTVVVSTRSVTYKQATGFTGVETFKVDFSDGPTIKTITVEVTVENTRPVAPSVSQRYHRREALGGLQFNLISTASDPDSDPLTATSAVKSSSTAGSVALSSGVATYTMPSNNFVSTSPESFVYTVTDTIQSATGTVSITIYNTRPVLYEKTVSSHWRNMLSGFWIDCLDGSFTGGSASANVDKDDDPLDTLTVTSVTQATGATVAITTSPRVSFTLQSSAKSNTPMQFVYTATDGASNGAASQTITVTATNSAPTASNVAVSKHWKEGTFDIDMTSHMSDNNAADASFLQVVELSGSSFASVTNGGKTVRFSKTVVASDINKTIKLTYKVFDGIDTSNQAEITITFTNTAPSAQDYPQTIQWNESEDINLQALCSDDNVPDSVSVSRVAGVTPANIASLNSNNQAQATIKGTLQVVTSSPLTVRYTPLANMVYTSTSGNVRSTDSTWKFTCFDGIQSTDGTVTITVRNTAPTAENKEYDKARQPGVTQYIAENVLPINSVDDDNDALTLVNVVGGTIVNGRDVRVTVGALEERATFTYQVFDGQLYSNTATVVVNVGNTPPTCNPVSRTINKGASTSIDISQICSDINGDAISFSSVGQPAYGSRSVTNSNTRVTFTAPTDRSGEITISVTARDPFGATASTTITINVVNRAPTANNQVWQVTAYRNTRESILPIATFRTNAAASDPDTYDATRLTIQSVNAGTCGNAANGDVFVRNGDIVFNRVYTFSSGSCSFTVTIKDADPVNPLTATSTVTVQVSTSGIVAVGKTVKVRDGNDVFQLSTSEITENDYDPLGGSFTFEGFDYTICGPGFCRDAAKPTQSGNRFTFTTKSVNCQMDRFRYKIRSVQDPSVETFGVLNVEYTHCSCKVPVDMVFVVDSSGSVGEDNFKKMKEFLESFASNFEFASSTNDPQNKGATMGIVRFASMSNGVKRDMSGNRNTVLDNIKNLGYSGGGTWILDALRDGEQMLKDQGRPNVPNKVIMLMFDGEPNGPCSCGDCRSRYSGSNNVIKEAQCKSARFPARTCNSCSLSYNWNMKCNPCSDAVPLAHDINSRKPLADGSIPNGYWRVIPVGIGMALSNADSQKLLADLSYDPQRSFYVQWDQLEELYQTVSDQTCNLIDIAGPKEPLQLAEPADPPAIKCGDIVTMRGPYGYLWGSSTYMGPNLDRYPNTGGTDRSGLFQVVCRNNPTGTDLTYGMEFSIWNLQEKRFGRRNSDDYQVTFVGTTSDFTNNNARVRWEARTVDATNSGKVYYDNSICLGSVSSNRSLRVSSWPLILDRSCTDANTQIYMVRIPWSDIANLNMSPALSRSELPMPTTD